MPRKDGASEPAVKGDLASPAKARSLPWLKSEEVRSMGRAFILWLLGVPVSVIVILWLIGVFH
jgi:hypothetical protein